MNTIDDTLDELLLEIARETMARSAALAYEVEHFEPCEYIEAEAA